MTYLENLLKRAEKIGEKHIFDASLTLAANDAEKLIAAIQKIDAAHTRMQEQGWEVPPFLYAACVEARILLTENGWQAPFGEASEIKGAR